MARSVATDKPQNAEALELCFWQPIEPDIHIGLYDLDSDARCATVDDFVAATSV